MKTIFEKIPDNTTYQPIIGYGSTTDNFVEVAQVKSLKIHKQSKEVVLVDKFNLTPIKQ